MEYFGQRRWIFKQTFSFSSWDRSNFVKYLVKKNKETITFQNVGEDHIYKNAVHV